VGHQGLETDTKGQVDFQPRRGGSGEEVGWTADSRWVYSGSADGSVCFWDLLAFPRIPEENRPPGHTPKTLSATIRKKPVSGLGPSRAVRFNPRHAMLAVGGDELVSQSFG
jgi:COMPASS component SWD2